MKAKDGFPLWVWVVGPAVALLAAVVVLAVLRDGDGADPGAAEAVTYEDVADNPQRFYGETVTVRGGVIEVLGPRSLLIGERFVAGDLLVVSSAPLRETLDEPEGIAFLENNTVRARGEVRRLDLTSAERETGADLEEDALEAYVGTTAIIADSVSLERPGSADKDGAPGASGERG